jgi:hypothetical protein
MLIGQAERYINPYTDFGFKKLFGTAMNKQLLISFLNALLEGKRCRRANNYEVFNEVKSEMRSIQRS